MLAAAIAVARELSILAAREALVGEPTEPDSPRLRQYLVRRLCVCREECVMVLYFTAEGLFIAEDFHEGGHGSTATLPLRRTVRRAFDLDARRLVIAHNHPSGNPEPSAADIRSTRHFIDVAGALDFMLDDHVVVGGNRAVSLRDRGLI
jgi:DNA repair protein RadC